MEVSVLIPAHNQEHIIEHVLQSVIHQTIKPMKIVVIADNCTDKTIEVSRKFKEVEVFETIDNKTRKAGALNQALYSINLNEFVFILDGDTILDENALKYGLEYLIQDPELGAVCSKACIVKPDNMDIKEKIIWGIQHIEYGGFDSHRVETRGKIKVAHGMATIFRRETLFDIPKIRKGLIPKISDEENKIFLENSLVEDYELTLCLKHRWKASSCLDMLAYTDVPLSIKSLTIQRTRWLRGGVDALRLHPKDTITIIEWMSILLFLVMIILRTMVGLATIEYLVVNGLFIPPKIILIVLSVIYIDSFYRMKYVKDRTKIDWIIKFTFIPEILYAWFQAYLLMKSFMLSIFNIKQRW